MNLHEYQARDLLARYGIPVPPGRVAASSEEAEAIARELGSDVVVKAQVHSGGRGQRSGDTSGCPAARVRSLLQVLRAGAGFGSWALHRVRAGEATGWTHLAG